MKDRGPIPDRVSLDPKSPYYFPMWKKIGVKLDGRVIFNCIEFYVSARWCRRTVYDAKGRPKKERGIPVGVLVRGDIEPYWRD